MLDPVPLKPKDLDRYRKSVGEEPVDRIRALAGKLSGARILHVNATAYGGGVAELLATLVPLMQGVGLDARWEVMFGNDDFYNVTKAMHNALQGMEIAWTPQMEKIYLDRNIENVGSLDTDYDFVIIHDPQPAALLHILEYETQQLPRGKWIWRCHIDTSTPFRPVAESLFPKVEPYDAAVFTMADFVPGEWDLPPVRLIQPCIDPLSLKNVPLNEETQQAILESYGIDPARPILCQVSRFDPWKDPVGVIDAYRLVKEEIPGVQLILAGSMATDDPEGMHYLHRTEEHVRGDPDVFILTNAQQVGAIEINAFQDSADVVIQKSLREGFGLTVSEGLWKGTPVVGGDCGGIRLQLPDGVGGHLVDSVEECADACLSLLKDPEQAARTGAAGKEHVRENFVMTTLLENWLRLFLDLQDGSV